MKQKGINKSQGIELHCQDRLDHVLVKLKHASRAN